MRVMKGENRARKKVEIVFEGRKKEGKREREKKNLSPLLLLFGRKKKLDLFSLFCPFFFFSFFLFFFFFSSLRFRESQTTTR